jgi:hypothetical protein
MEAPNLGSDWFWYIVLICAAIGFAYAVIKLLQGIVWLCEHVRFV